MANYLPLPNGSLFPVMEGESPQDAWLAAQQKYPEAFVAKEAEPPPKKGIGAAVGRGLSS